jgi:beta-glucosidase
MRPSPCLQPLPASSIALAAVLALSSCGGEELGSSTQPWLSPSLIDEQAAASTDAAKEAVANKRAQALIAAMTLDQKLQQLTGALPEIVPELPHCKGGRHVSGIAALGIPTLRVTNGPVGLGQNDCVSASIPPIYFNLGGERVDITAYTDASSAKATALPSAMGAAASFDPAVAAAYGDVIGTEMLNLALHVFEAPGMNLSRLPILGRNFEYFGEDPYLAGVMSVAEIKAVQAKGLIGMAKHFVANEQETNRTTVQETVDRQVLRELYLLPFEMSVKDGKVASIMCAYNYVNGLSSCAHKEHLTDILRTDWGFSGYVQSDFYATKTTVDTLAAGMDHMMPTPQQWAPDKLEAALNAGAISQAQIDMALQRRYTQMFKYGIFERPLKQTDIDFAANGKVARDIGVKSAVLLQNHHQALPFAATVRNVVLIGKATQVYAQHAVVGGQMVGQKPGAGGGSSDVVPNYVVLPLDGIKQVLQELGNTTATVKLVLVDDANSNATIDGAAASFAQAMAAAAAADAVIVMAGTISEEGADRASFANASGKQRTAIGDHLDWYVKCPASADAVDGSVTCRLPAGVKNIPADSKTVAMIEAVIGTASTTGKTMLQKTALVLKDNAGVAMPPSLVGPAGPAMLEVWFPGQEDGHIVADLLFGRKNPSGKLPVSFPYVGKGFLDHASAQQFPGLVEADGVTQTVEYTEQLHIGYRWYDGNVSGQCAVDAATKLNPCVAFPFGHGLSYTSFAISGASVVRNAGKYDVKATVKNTGSVAGSEVVQVYLSFPSGSTAYAGGAVQPPKRLVGFAKVELAPGASREVTITVDPAASNHPLSFWSKTYNSWISPAGSYALHVGSSSSPKDLTTLSFTR